MISRRFVRLLEERGLLLAFATLAAALMLFLKLGSEVMEGESRAFEAMILEAVRDATDGSGTLAQWLRGFMIDLTTLGDRNTLVLIAAIATGYLLAAHRIRLAFVLAAGLATGGFLEVLLKHLYARPRPDIVAHLVDVSSASFPSGHAMDSAMVYLTIAALLWRVVPGRAARIYTFCVALMLTMAIGLSRVYLGVHWPTDVLAGWIAGSVWATLCSMAARRLGAGEAVPRA